MEIADIPEENKGGDCYQCAANYVMSHPETHSLAHAVVTGQGPIEGLRYGHAFVLFDRDGVEYVKDLNADVEMPSALYFAVGRIDPEKVVTYSSKEMFQKMSEFETWGPWDETIHATFHTGGCPKCGTPTEDDSEGYEFCPKRDCDWFEEGLDARHE